MGKRGSSFSDTSLKNYGQAKEIVENDYFLNIYKIL
uniref:Uncharacterized protein n=1 Tax=Anguilla anguilla TaxID=7936 RepID=A0A0E9PG04_ANGAN